MVGYATAYTMAPVFSLVLDRDVSEDLALLYPELYKDLTKVSKIGMRFFKDRSDEVLCLGPSSFVQDVLYVAHDQRLPRYITNFIPK